MAEIISHLGADISKIGPSSWKIHPQNIQPDPPYELVRKMRASICLLGPLVARIKKAKVPMPGGCVIGHRPIDLHLHALQEMGAEISLNQGIVEVDGSAMKAGNLFIGGRHGSTVTGTANAIMAAVLTPGTTTLDGAACEPEIVDLCAMLKKMGANISGAGSHLLTIEGVDQLNGCVHRVIPDRIEAATYIMGAAITRGKIQLHGIETSHLGAFSKVMRESGVLLESSKNGKLDVHTEPNGLSPFEIITLPYPGFPLIYKLRHVLWHVPSRSQHIDRKSIPEPFMHIPELLRMGAEVSLEDPCDCSRRKMFKRCTVMASDLRASAALILAGLAAEGETWVHRIYHLDRGYEFMDQKLRKLGAEVERLPESSLPPAFRRPSD